MIETEQLVAMAVAAVAEEMGSDADRIRVNSFVRVHESELERYVDERGIQYRKYQLEGELL